MAFQIQIIFFFFFLSKKEQSLKHKKVTNGQLLYLIKRGMVKHVVEMFFHQRLQKNVKTHDHYGLHEGPGHARWKPGYLYQEVTTGSTGSCLDLSARQSKITSKMHTSDDKIKLLTWPSQTPDLNLTENLRDELKTRVHERGWSGEVAYWLFSDSSLCNSPISSNQAWWEKIQCCCVGKGKAAQSTKRKVQVTLTLLFFINRMSLRQLNITLTTNRFFWNLFYRRIRIIQDCRYIFIQINK